MSADDIFTGGIAELVKRRAERQEADRQRMEEQARGPIRCRHDSHRLIVYHGLSEPTLPCLWRAVRMRAAVPAFCSTRSG
jgi:hypothetical protein